MALAVRASPPASGARARRPPSPSRLAGGGAVLPGGPRSSLERGGARRPGPAEARGAAHRRLCRRRRRGGHDRGAERAAAERGAEGEASPGAGAAGPRSSFRRAVLTLLGSDRVLPGLSPTAARASAAPGLLPRRPPPLSAAFGGVAPSARLRVGSGV